MKAMIVCGSRGGGFTSEMCVSFSNGLAVNGISSEVLFPADMRIEHCIGCGDCYSEGKCRIKDDMDMVFRTFGEADLLVLATPIHFSGPSSIIKTVIDRFQPFWFRTGEHPRFASALLSGGGPSPNYDNTISIFKAFSITAGMKWLGHLMISNTDEKEMWDVAGPSFDYGEEIGLKMMSDSR